MKFAFAEVRTQVANLNTFVQERISGMQIVQLFVREQKEYASFQQINELSPVNFLRKQLASLQICRNVDLPHILQTVEDVLPRFLAFNLGLALMFLGSLQPPKGVTGVSIPVEELGRLARVVEHGAFFDRMPV